MFKPENWKYALVIGSLFTVFYPNTAVLLLLLLDVSIHIYTTRLSFKSYKTYDALRNYIACRQAGLDHKIRDIVLKRYQGGIAFIKESFQKIRASDASSWLSVACFVAVAWTRMLLEVSVLTVGWTRRSPMPQWFHLPSWRSKVSRIGSATQWQHRQEKAQNRYKSAARSYR